MLKKTTTANGRIYEGFFIFRPDSGPEAKKTEWHQLETILKRFKAVILGKTELGKKSLGYTIKKCTEGEMVAITFELEPAYVADLHKALTLEESIIKYLITIQKGSSADKVSKKPSQETKPHVARKAHETEV